LIAGAILAFRPYEASPGVRCRHPVQELAAPRCGNTARARTAGGAALVAVGTIALVVWFRRSFLLRQELSDDDGGEPQG